jgi:hypothetical protein
VQETTAWADRYRHGFICTEERTEAVQRRPTSAEGEVLDEYRRRYREAVGYAPHGLHYLPMPGEAETVAVFFTLPED